MVWSAEGRAQPTVVRLIDNAIRLFRNRHGMAEATAIALQRREAAMFRAVIPKQSDRQVWLSGGGLDGTTHSRLPSIIEEPDD